MKTKTLMSKVTLGAALVLTTATVATSVVVNPSVVKADDYVVADKNAEIYTIYDISGYGNVSWYAIFDENGVLYPDLAKLRDYEYTTVSKDGIWSVGPNGEKNWDPNAVKPEPTTPSTTEPTTTDDYVVTDKDAKIYTLYGLNGFSYKLSYNEIYGSGLIGKQVFKLRDFEYTEADPFTGLWYVGPNGERDYDPNSSTTEPTTPSATEPTTPSTTEPTTPSTTEPTTPSATEPTTPSATEPTTTTSETTTATSEKPEDVTKPSTQTTTTTPTKATEESTPSTSETTTATSEKPEDVTKLSTQTTTTTPTKATEEIETLPKTGDASILSMLAGTGILSGLGLTSLKRKFKK